LGRSLAKLFIWNNSIGHKCFVLTKSWLRKLSVNCILLYEWTC
jgi:hypothetical protein